MYWRIETKTELREALRGKTVREVKCKGALTDTRELELRLADGQVVLIQATSYGTLRIEV